MPTTTFQHIFRQSPTDLARLLYKLIQVLTQATGIGEEHEVYRPLRAVKCFQDLDAIDWTTLSDRLTANATCPGEQVTSSLSETRLVISWAVLYHQLYRAKSSITLLYTREWHLPWYRFPPELERAVSTATGMLEEIDTALKLGRAAVTRFQRFAAQGGDLSTLQAILQEASRCLATYQHAKEQAFAHLGMMAWYLEQVNGKSADLAHAPTAA